MKVFFISTLQKENQGGLFKATYEKIVRHESKINCYVVNNNYYDTKIIRLLKKKIGKIEATEQQDEQSQERGLLIHNLNFQNCLWFYLKRKIRMEKSFLKDVSKYYMKKYKSQLEKSDIIHAHWGYPNGYIAYIISEKLNKPFFISFYGSDLNNLKGSEVTLALKAMERAEKCFFVSHQLLKNAINMGYSGLNAEITYSGVDLDLFKRSKKRISGSKKVGYIGALEKIKGADLLPDIFQEIAKLNDSHIQFSVIGGGTLRDSIECSMKRNGTPVEFTGHLPPNDIPVKLEEIDVLVVPSRQEGFGIVVLEAYAMGIPVIASNVGGLPEAIGFEENLINFNGDFISSMAIRVNEVLNDDDEDINKYRNRINEKYRWDEAVRIERLWYNKAFHYV